MNLSELEGKSILEPRIGAMPSKRLHADWLSAYIDYTKHSEAPTRMHFWAGVSAIAGALQRKVWLDLGHFKWYANFYIVFVAPPGGSGEIDDKWLSYEPSPPSGRGAVRPDDSDMAGAGGKIRRRYYWLGHGWGQLPSYVVFDAGEFGVRNPTRSEQQGNGGPIRQPLGLQGRGIGQSDENKRE